MILSQWKQTVLTQLLRGLPIQPQAETPIYVLGGDVNRVQSYIFESSRLPDIRGASLLLSALNGEPDINLRDYHPQRSMISALQTVGLNANDVVYMGGGSLLALLPDEPTANALAEELRRCFPVETGVATLSTAVVAATATQITNNFDKVIEKLQTRLRLEKSNIRQPFYERLSFMRTCAACQMRPAVDKETFDNEDFPICQVCQKKTKIGRQARRQRLRYYSAESETPQDLGELGLLSNGEIAFIYADGDGFGKFVFGAKNPVEFRKRSDLIRDGINSALRFALQDLIPQQIVRQDGSTERIRPFEVVTVGGDDVLILLPAKYGLAVACDLVDGFAKHIQEKTPSQPLSLSVGIAFGHDSTPIRLLREIARDVLKSSAKRYRAEHKEKQGYIDFHDITREGLVLNKFAKFREQDQYQVKSGKYVLSLTTRPCTLSALRRLLQISSKFKNEKFPRSQMNALVAEMRGIQRGALFYRYQRTRLKRYEGSFAALELEWGIRVEDVNNLWPWQETTQTANILITHQTPLQDLLLVMNLSDNDEGS